MRLLVLIIKLVLNKPPQLNQTRSKERTGGGFKLGYMSVGAFHLGQQKQDTEEGCFCISDEGLGTFYLACFGDGRVEKIEER